MIGYVTLGTNNLARAAAFYDALLARPEASPALRAQVSSLSQLRPADSAGRFPVELEFSF